MATITLRTRDGSSHPLDVRTDMTLMENIRQAGFDELAAMCGGCCSCATCHVYLYDGADAMVTQRSPDEQDLLDASDHFRENSRLACQVDGGMLRDGQEVQIAPED